MKYDKKLVAKNLLRIADELDPVAEAPVITTVTPDLFFARLFETRDYLHLAHLRVAGPGAYAAHKALNEAYDGILDLTDGLVESYQGIHGIVEIKLQAVESTAEVSEVIAALKKLNDFIIASRPIFPESFIQNEIDEIQKLIASSLYKLTNLN